LPQRSKVLRQTRAAEAERASEFLRPKLTALELIKNAPPSL
jgi:hypothetical protein